MDEKRTQSNELQTNNNNRIGETFISFGWFARLAYSHARSPDLFIPFNWYMGSY